MNAFLPPNDHKYRESPAHLLETARYHQDPQEDESTINISSQHYLNHSPNCSFHIFTLRFGSIVAFNRIHTTRNRIQRSIVEVLLHLTLQNHSYLETTCLQCSTHHNQFQIRTTRKQLFQETHHQIC